MDNKNFKKSYNEVLEILKYIPKSDYEKIPENVIHEYRIKSNLQYQFKYNENLPLKYQNLSSDTLDILAVLYKKYMSSDDESARIKRYDAMRQKQIENEKIKRYNVDNIFKNRQNNSGTIKKDQVESNAICLNNTGKLNIRKRVLNLLKKIFKIQKNK